MRSSSPLTGALLLALLVLTLPHLRGNVEGWTAAAVVAIALAAVTAGATRSLALPRAAAALSAVLAIQALQLIPVPPAFHALSPGAVRIFDVSLRPLGEYPAARPLSLEPASSAHEFAMAIASAAAFTAAWCIAGLRRERQYVTWALALSGIAVAAVVLTAALLGEGAIPAPRFPFVNPNHLAGFLNLTSFVAMGLALGSRGGRRALWVMAFVCTGALVLLSLSRAGIGAFVVGAGAFVFLQLRAGIPASHRFRSFQLAVVAAALTIALGTAAFVALGAITSEVRTIGGAAAEEKLRLLAPAFHMMREFPAVGIGPGAFPVVFSGYQVEPSTVTFTHLENQWIQPGLDLGVPAGLLVVATFGWIWISTARRRDLSPIDIGLLAGTAALGAHDAFDFSTGTVAVALPFAVAMGLLARRQRAFPIPRAAVFAGAALVLAAAVIALRVSTAHGLEADRDAIDRARDATGAEVAARRALRWHPADWIAQAAAGVRTAEGDCRRGMPWLVRAMALAPFAPDPHLVSARCLIGKNDAAAKREYRLALMYGRPILAEAAAHYGALVDLLDIAPGTPDGLLELGTVLAAERPRDAAVVFERGLVEFSDDRAIVPLARVRIALGEAGAALQLARRRTLAKPLDPDGWLLAAGSLVRLGLEEEGRSELERGLVVLPGSPPLLSFLAERAIARGRWSEAKSLAERITAEWPAEVAQKHLLVGAALAGQGRTPEAFDRAEAAASANPAAQEPWVAVAAYAATMGRHDAAITALRRAAALPGAPPDGYAARISLLEASRDSDRERARLDRVLGAPPSGGGERDAR